MTLDLSLGEVQALSLKAARGAGRPFGLAEEAAFATRFLIERGYDGAGALAALLQATDGTDARCPLALGVALSDSGAVLEGEIGPVVCPLMVAPFLVGLCGAGRGLSLRAGEGVISIGVDGAMAGSPLPTTLAPLIITDCASPAAFMRQTRAQVSQEAFATLTVFAARTYAPATEESRAKGAGAGLSDND